MEGLGTLFLAHPLWVWLAIGAIFLTFEVITGSGWLLWPAGSAGVVAVFALVHPVGMAGEAALFAVVAIASTYLGRRYLRKAPFQAGPDVNDPQLRLMGHRGKAVATFHAGVGRVFVEGKEWSAELEGGGAIAIGAKVEVTAVLGGAKLRVKAVP
jgi:membrane protein implicated in regulation of membrane protease activity